MAKLLSTAAKLPDQIFLATGDGGCQSSGDKDIRLINKNIIKVVAMHKVTSMNPMQL